MSKWTHNICKECWNKKNPEREPIVLKTAELEKCCFCGKENHDGIYIRHDPKTLTCSH